ncbi:MAG: DUF2273 domain-containing protein [Selenomonadaceae bacterium]|nr:DUF2273 domain-containing protein [Selenomonadaceae bacterium]MBQ3726995.1 DUF2273 domain-containing protein [Selenomonadaceae bacterium]MBQ9497666.1 DUF2273 domain-containing protein [Selenomonadaceae bacterium]MBR3498398.1 DUF2273 domain-containing protein [Selenomonadaceae bacterium]
MFVAIKNFVIDLFESHRTRKIGFITGLVTGGAILLIGFFNTLFILLCGTIGLFIGSRFDSKDDLIEKILMKLDEVLPEKIQRW